MFEKTFIQEYTDRQTDIDSILYIYRLQLDCFSSVMICNIDLLFWEQLNTIFGIHDSCDLSDFHTSVFKVLKAFY